MLRKRRLQNWLRHWLGIHHDQISLWQTLSMTQDRLNLTEKRLSELANRFNKFKRRFGPDLSIDLDDAAELHRRAGSHVNIPEGKD